MTAKCQIAAWNVIEGSQMGENWKITWWVSISSWDRMFAGNSPSSSRTNQCFLKSFERSCLIPGMGVIRVTMTAAIEGNTRRELMGSLVPGRQKKKNWRGNWARRSLSIERDLLIKPNLSIKWDLSIQLNLLINLSRWQPQIYLDLPTFCQDPMSAGNAWFPVKA